MYHDILSDLPQLPDIQELHVSPVSKISGKFNIVLNALKSLLEIKKKNKNEKGQTFSYVYCT